MLFLLALLPALCLASPVREDGSSSRIINGTEARIEDYPYMAQLYYDTAFECGGALIDPMWVLTAAHCVEFSNSTEPRLLNVHLGSEKLYNNSVMPQMIGADDVFVHPGWIHNDNVSNVAFPNDIALIKLLEPADILGPRVDTVALPPAGTTGPEPYPNSYCRISGWGKRYGNVPELPSNLLMEAPTNVISNTECEAMYHDDAGMEYLDISDGQTCIYYPATWTGPCSGDSGGPLSCYDSFMRPEVSGVTSFVEGLRCHTDAPAVYTRVSYYESWISDVMANN